MEKLKRYDLNCNIFDVYDYDGLSMQELLCQFYTKINECVDFSNSTLDLCEWLVNEGLNLEVATKLTTWLNDGTLENIINVTLFENLNKKVDNVTSQLEYMVNKSDCFIYANNPPKGLEPLRETNEDNTVIFDNILKYAKENNKSVYVRKGIYKLKYINMYDKVSIIGEGKGKTIFLTLPGSDLNFMRTNDLVVSQASYKDFSLWGGIDRDNINSPNQNMLCLISKDGGNSGNGTWYCNFESIEITHFNGVGILIEDSYSDSRHPNQFNNFNDIQVFRVNGYGKCLSIKGQCGQHFFKNCSFDNNGRNPGIGNLTNFKDGLGVNIDINGGNLITFENTTSQNSSNIANISNAKNITFKNCWFENSKKCITIDNAVNVNIYDSNFSNVCSDGNGSGYGVYVTGGNSYVNIFRNSFLGDIDYTVQSNGNVGNISCKDNNGLIKNKGIVKQRTSSSEDFGVGGSKLIQFVNNNSIISTLTSTHSVGEIFVIMFGGGGSTTINNLGNIELPNGKTSLTFKNCDSATFIKNDLQSSKEYLLISYTCI